MKSIFGGFLILIPICPILVSAIAGGAIIRDMFLRLRPGSSLDLIMAPVLGLLEAALLTLGLVVVVSLFGRALFSYLLISDQGIEYHIWPFQRIYATWDDVEHIYKSPLPFQGMMLGLRKAETSGYWLNFGFRKAEADAGKIKGMPLYEFSGWSSGNIAEEIRKHAPGVL